MAQRPIQTQAGSADSVAGLAPLFGQQPASEISPTQPVREPIAKGDGQEEAPTYLTQEGLDKWWEGKEPDVLQSAGRKAQSVSDAAASKRQKLQDAALTEVTAQIKRITDGGGSVTPAVQQQWKSAAVQQANAQTPPEPQAPAPQGQQQPGNQAPPTTTPDQPQAEQMSVPQWLDDRVKSLTQEQGFVLDKNDPEAASVNMGLINTDPILFLEEYKKGIEAKRNRLIGASSRGATPGFGTGGQSVNMAQNYQNEIIKARGNARKIVEIRRRYQRQGLDTNKVNLPI